MNGRVVWEGKQEVTGIAGGPHGGLVKVGNALVPPRALLTFEGIKGAPDATMTFEIRDGRPECIEVTVKAKPDGRGIRSDDIALIKIDSITIDTFAQVGSVAVYDPAERRQVFRDVQEARAARRGAVTREELEQVARVYRDHLTSSPTRAVGQLLGYGERTAARRVQQARAAGLLPKTSPGKRKA